MKINSAKFRLATPDDIELDTYDNTKLVALNTCPTWGVLRYQMHKRMPGSGRAMALEAGTAMHDVFAWVRLWHWAQQNTKNFPISKIEEACAFHGFRLFGRDRYNTVIGAIPTREDFTQQCKLGALTILETSGFYDDPKDRRRTMGNLEECALAYIDRWNWKVPVWMRNNDDLFGDIGIEIPFDLVVNVETVEDASFDWPASINFRLTGKIDGIHVHDDKITLHENKTASRLNEAWSMSFALATQVTGYCLAASTFTEASVNNAVIHGLSIPLPKSYDFGGIVREHVSRKDYHYQRWIEWAVHTVAMYEQYKNNPIDSPKYTHSCNRYFQPCSFIPFCDNDSDEQKVVLEQMVTEEWSPLHEKTGE